MSELINQIIELYFLGGSIKEMLKEIEVNRRRIESKRWARELYYETFRSW